MTVAFVRVADAASMTMLMVAIAGFARGTDVLADGGTLQLERSDGPFIITVFTTPTPLRAGRVDISLMIRNRENQQAVLDCDARVQLRKEGAMTLSSQATHEAARNKILYGAEVQVPESGLWEVEATITRGGFSTDIAGEIAIGPPEPILLAHWRSLALPPLFISLFAMHQVLKRRSAKGAKR